MLKGRLALTLAVRVEMPGLGRLVRLRVVSPPVPSTTKAAAAAEATELLTANERLALRALPATEPATRGLVAEGVAAAKGVAMTTLPNAPTAVALVRRLRARAVCLLDTRPDARLAYAEQLVLAAEAASPLAQLPPDEAV